MPMRVEVESPEKRSCNQRSEIALSIDIRYRQSHHVDLSSNSSVIRGLELGYIPLSSSLRDLSPLRVISLEITMKLKTPQDLASARNCVHRHY